MLSREEQKINKIYSDEELERFSQEMFNSEAMIPLIVDSHFGIQYFKYIDKASRKRSNKNFWE